MINLINLYGWLGLHKVEGMHLTLLYREVGMAMAKNTVQLLPQVQAHVRKCFLATFLCVQTAAVKYIVWIIVSFALLFDASVIADFHIHSRLI